MWSEAQIRWLSQLQRVQDLLSQQHQLSLVVLDANCVEMTVPSGLPTECGSADPTHSGPCWRMRRNTISRVQSTRRVETLPCPRGRCCFVSPLGVVVDDYDAPVQYFLAGSGLHPTAATSMVQEVFRLITPLTPPSPTPSPVPQQAPHPTAAPVAGIPLTRREMEVLALIGAGFSNRAIAKELYISQATVKTHITHLLQKLGLENRTEAALYAVRESIRPTAKGDTRHSSGEHRG